MKFAQQLRVEPGDRFRLAGIDPDSTPGAQSKEKALEELDENQRRLFDLQYLLYAENKRSLLIVLQAMDAGGKDGVIRAIAGGLNPQGCTVTPFKTPSAEELDHHFLWRIQKATPAKGEIAIFNRSHYEDVLIARVMELVPRPVWTERYEQINAFEQLLAGNGTVVLKFFLHISKEEQKERLAARLADPRKHWKLAAGDFAARDRWNDYMEAYEAALTRCSTTWAPWFVIPANKKWYRNLAVSRILVETLEGLRMKFPKPPLDVAKIRLK